MFHTFLTVTPFPVEMKWGFDVLWSAFVHFIHLCGLEKDHLVVYALGLKKFEVTCSEIIIIII